MELVDTPGTGSVFEWDTETAHEALQSMDAAVFVLTADPPVSASERDLLGRVAGLSVTTFAVLNKADHLDEAALAEAVEFTRRVLVEAGHPGTVYPMSARAALDGGDAGFTAFEADFTAYLSTRRKSDLRASAIAQARRIAGSLLDEVALTRRAAGCAPATRRIGCEQFGARLAEVAVQSRDAVVVVNGESARLLSALNDAADEDAPQLGREITGQLDALFDGELRAASPAEIERRGRQRLAAFTVAAAEGWRQQRTEAIEQGLAQVDARLAADLKAKLDVLRESAAELLGLDLAVPDPERPAGRRAGGSSTTPRRTSARPSCSPALSAAGSPASSAGGRPGSICAAKPLAWWTARSAGPRGPAVPARGGDAGAGAGGGAAPRRRHRPNTVRAAAAADLREASAAEAGRKERELDEREAGLRHAIGLLDQAAAPTQSGRCNLAT